MGVEFEARAIRRRLGLPRSPAPPPSAPLILRTVGLGADLLPRLGPDLEALRPEAVLVTGLAGGCAPMIAPGEVVVGSVVRLTSQGEGIAPDPGLLTRATRALDRAALPFHVGRLLTAPEVVATPEVKADYWRAHAALAVDMESAHVLAWAARVGIPALAVRAVADGSGDTVPPALARAVGPGGRVRLSVVLRWVGRPELLGPAWRLRRQAGVALDRLARFLAAFTRTPVAP